VVWGRGSAVSSPSEVAEIDIDAICAYNLTWHGDNNLDDFDIASQQ